MPVKKRSPKARVGVIRDDAMRTKVVRLLALNDDHLAAIQSTSNDQAFYRDGRHNELTKLVGEVHPALGIRPWEDSTAMLEAALAAYDKRA
jgi:hypothetical protein